MIIEDEASTLGASTPSSFAPSAVNRGWGKAPVIAGSADDADVNFAMMAARTQYRVTKNTNSVEKTL